MCGKVFRTSNGGEGWVHDQAAEDALLGPLTPPSPAATKSPAAEAFAAGAGQTLEALRATAQRGHLEFMHWFSPSEGVAGGYIGATVMRTVDGGKTWARLSIPDKQWVYAVATRGETIWICGSSGAIVRSTDRGLTWTKRSSPFDGDRCMELSFGADRSGRAIGMSGSQWSTTDDGETWKRDPTTQTADERARLRNTRHGGLSPRGKGTVRISDEGLLVFDDPGGGHRSAPVRSIATRRRIPLEAVERFEQAAYGWTTAQLFYAEDGASWYLLGALPTAPRRITFLNGRSVVLEGAAGTYRSEDRGTHWSPSAYAPFDLADAEGARDRAAGRARAPFDPFACLGTTTEGDLNVEIDVRGDFATSQSGLHLAVHQGATTLDGLLDQVRSTTRVEAKALSAVERARLLEEIAALTTRAEEPSRCWSTTKESVDLTWRCATEGPDLHGRLSFQGDMCASPDVAAADAKVFGRPLTPPRYARAIGIAAWATALLKRTSQR